MQTTIAQKNISTATPVNVTTSGYYAVLFSICFICSALGGTVSTLMSVYLPVVVKDVLGSREVAEINRISAYINALFIYGWAFGGFSWGVISDRIGRKKALLLAIACYGIFTVLTGMMSNWWSIVICRFFSGFGVGGVLVVSFTLLSEVWPSKSRAIFIGILSIAFPVGIFSAGLINYLFSSWRQGFFVGIIPLVMAFSGAWLLKESEEWKNNTAYKRKPFQSLFSGSSKRKIWMGSVIFGTMLIGLWAIFSWLPTWIQSLVKDTDAQKERSIALMLLGMTGIAGGFFSGWVANSLGLKRAMIMCFAVCAVLSFILFRTNQSFSNIIYLEIALLAFFFGISQGILSAYIPQLFSTENRATATGFCFNIGRLFTATAVLGVGVLVTVLGGYGNALFIFSLVFVLGLVVMLFVNEK